MDTRVLPPLPADPDGLVRTATAMRVLDIPVWRIRKWTADGELPKEHHKGYVNAERVRELEAIRRRTPHVALPVQAARLRLHPVDQGRPIETNRAAAIRMGTSVHQVVLWVGSGKLDAPWRGCVYADQERPEPCQRPKKIEKLDVGLPRAEIRMPTTHRASPDFAGFGYEY